MTGRERILFRDNPGNADIDQLLQEATDNWAPRGSKQDIRKHEYFSQIRLHMEEEYRPKLDELTTILNGHLLPYDDIDAYADFTRDQNMEYSIGGGKYNLQTVEGVRQAISGLGGQLGGFYDELQSEYPDVVIDLDQKRLDKMETAPLEDLAYYEYISEVVLQEFPILNSAGDVIGYDTAARREANDAFKARWGNDMYQLVRDRRTMTKDASPLLQELELGREKHEAFWRIDELLMENERFDFNTNLSLRSEWENYLKAKAQGPQVIEALYKDNPGLLRDLKQFDSGVTAAKKLYRERNQDFDAWYYRWGYSNTLLHPDNDDNWQAKGEPIWFQ